MNIGNITPTEIRKQAFLVAPPLKRKLPQDCFLSFIDQIQDGLYGSAKLVRSQPRTTADSYFKFRPRKAKPTEMRSYRRNYSHRSVALFRTKAGGSTRGNIEYLTCSFLELDGANDSTIKSLEDVQTLISKNSLPTASYVSQTSSGNFHILWDYTNPLPWTTKNESYWTSQQKRLIELFRQGGFNVDVGASMNPTQNLRNPSQLRAFNFKRNCEVFIHSSYRKTSLRAIYKALNSTNIQNPKPVPASTKLRRYLRANQTFEITLSQLAKSIGTSIRTVKRVVKMAELNGDLQIVRKVGNNKGLLRTTEYTSRLYIEPQFSGVPLVSIKTNSLSESNLMVKFKRVGAEKGLRQKTIFALGLEIKSRLGKSYPIEAIRALLEGGARLCYFPEREFERTLKNIMKPEYDNRFSLSKLQEWNLLAEPEHSRKSILH